MACLLHIYSTCARDIQHIKKACKVEASFLSFSVNLKIGGKMEKWIQPWPQNILWF